MMAVRHYASSSSQSILLNVQLQRTDLTVVNYRVLTWETRSEFFQNVGQNDERSLFPFLIICAFPALPLWDAKCWGSRGFVLSPLLTRWPGFDFLISVDFFQICLSWAQDLTYPAGNCTSLPGHLINTLNLSPVNGPPFTLVWCHLWWPPPPSCPAMGGQASWHSASVLTSSHEPSHPGD